MLINKEHLLAAIDQEIEEREDTRDQNESDSDEWKSVHEEVQSLKVLKDKVKAEQPLEYNEYEWLSYLAYNNIPKDAE